MPPYRGQGPAVEPVIVESLSPEQNAEAKARQERIESYLAVCRACPIDAFDGRADEGGYCTKHNNNACSFGKLLVSPMFRCEYWPSDEQPASKCDR